MEAFASSEFYLGDYGGTLISEDKLPARLAEASLMCDNFCISGISEGGGISALSEHSAELVRRAVCVQADHIEANGGLCGISEAAADSVKLGDFSYSSSSGTSGGLMCAAAVSFLESAGLCYRGASI